MNKKILALCMSGMIMGACTSKKAKETVTVADNHSEMYMLVGSYATPEEEGIKVYRFDEETGDATYVSGLKGISNPSYLTPSIDGERVYAVGEDEGASSTANAIFFNKEEGVLTLLNSQPTQGGAPCYITISPSGEFVITANYLGGSITVFALDKEGKLATDPRLISFTGNGPDAERQTQPHLHCVEFTPDYKYLLADDLGTDKIHIFPVSEEISAGVSHSLLDEGSVSEVKLEPGSGPRHICFHPNQKYAYLINEISGKVTALSYNKGKLHAMQYIEADTVGARGSGDIHISPDGRFVYASNRLQADGIAIFSVDEEKGTLTKMGYQLTGIHPRNFIITPNGRYLLVACRDSNQIQVFSINKETGLLTDTGKKIITSKPVCLKFTAY
ncbi:lactonase family protein [Phocaeicola sp.]